MKVGTRIAFMEAKHPLESQEDCVLVRGRQFILSLPPSPEFSAGTSMLATAGLSKGSLTVDCFA